MIRLTNSYFRFRLLCTISLICLDNISAVEWMSTYLEVYYKLITLPSSMLPDESIVSEQRNATTVMSCALFCAKEERDSLYYSQNERVSTNSSTLKYNIKPHQEDCFAHYDNGYTTNAIYTVKSTEGAVQDSFCHMVTLEHVLNDGADDCLQWLLLGYTVDGVYKIRLSNGTTVRVWCDQTGGGWTVFQRRYDGSVSFYRTWAEYVNGFGDPAGEYWLGLEAIYLLSQQESSLRIDMEAFEEEVSLKLTALASYGEFSLAAAADKYRLTIGAFTGDCGDSLVYHNQQRFSTFDSDNDVSPDEHCAETRKGAWWYKACTDSNLNGQYHGGHHTVDTSGMTWYTCWSGHYLVKACSMGIKRN